ncbi:NFACT family protein [Clostridium gasigenes]|uniref:Rqc2 homolog RqcH n=1 Tax=Clostridium gasigenes TaxID=94869 RepID=A0A7X0R521_9CLOT|nr:NFACT RNA binding domain-containing protein [Clostridium gasigenes]MBB6621811.1 NFACT family protein [Clostridium gasigenes]MBB6716326.1 NFACT family protein [Clostridium gasigenes]MBU3087353.1 NFACT family protein [Clostridium gasigenes]
MALDGIYLHGLVYNLKNLVLNAKIDKINQPEKDEIILTFRKDRKNLKLLISASSKFPRIHITNTNKVNPLKASTFTMVLRKYLIGGKITSFEQLSGDRILKLNIESTDELGFDSKYFLIVEIMGRHSNITLIRERDNKVMECIKHITPDINSFRVLYPGVNYVYPPASSRLNPFDFTLDNLKDYFSTNDICMSELVFTNVFTGISKPLSYNLYNSLSKENKNFSIDELYNFINNFISSLETNFSYRIYKTDSLYKDFYCLPLDTLENTYSVLTFENPSELLEEFFLIRDKQERLNSKSIDLQRLIQTNIDRCNKKSKKLYNMLKECEEKESFKIKGDLLTSYIYTLKKGDKEANLLNFYSEEEEYLTIPLDEFKSPSENIQLLYKKYNKYKKSEESAIYQLEQNDGELQYLNSVFTNIQNCDNYVEINDIKNELIETGYVRFKKTNKNGKKDKSSKPLHFISSDGLDIYVGKNNLQNDYLSLKFASNNHLWFHTKNIPGSHVIVSAPHVPDKTIEEAAILAAFYSKAKNSTKVPVDYTLVKNLKKPNGSKPGMVIYHTNYSLYTEPSYYTKLIETLTQI